MSEEVLSSTDSALRRICALTQQLLTIETMAIYRRLGADDWRRVATGAPLLLDDEEFGKLLEEHGGAELRVFDADHFEALPLDWDEISSEGRIGYLALAPVGGLSTGETEGYLVVATDRDVELGPDRREQLELIAHLAGDILSSSTTCWLIRGSFPARNPSRRWLTLVKYPPRSQ
ncbi:MAG: hypothetical protein ACOCV2_09895 [Persicimonas sp.]